MPSFTDNALDSLVDYIGNNATHFRICNAEPTTYTESSSTFKIGTKTTPTITAAADRSGGGRKRDISTFSDGSVEATDTATHYSLDDNTAELLLAQALSSSQAVTSGNTFGISAAIEFGVGDPT